MTQQTRFMEGHIHHKTQSGFIQSTRYVGNIPCQQGDKVVSFYDETVTLHNLCPSRHDDGKQYAFVDGKLTVMTLALAQSLASTALSQLIHAISRETGTEAHQIDSIESVTPLAMLTHIAGASDQSEVDTDNLDIKDAYNNWQVYSGFAIFLDTMESRQPPTTDLRKTRLAATALLTLHLFEQFEGGVDEVTAQSLPIFMMEYDTENEPLYCADYSRAIRILRNLYT